MNQINLDSNIFYIENFLSNKSHLQLLNFCNEGNFIFEDKYIKQRGIKYIDRQNNKDYINAYKEFVSIIEKMFNNDKHSLEYLSHVQTYKMHNDGLGYDKRWAMGPHFDDERPDIFNGEPIVYFGLVYYINDNYDGGEITYPNQNIKFKPKANTLVVHPGSSNYVHQVEQIFNYDRFQISAFIKNNKIKSLLF
jgi:hypothetical protein